MSHELDRDLCVELLLERVKEEGVEVFSHSVLVDSMAGSTWSRVLKWQDLYWPYGEDWEFVGPFQTLGGALDRAWGGEVLLTVAPNGFHELECRELSSAELAGKCIALPRYFEEFGQADQTEFELEINGEKWACCLEGDSTRFERKSSS